MQPELDAATPGAFPAVAPVGEAEREDWWRLGVPELEHRISPGARDGVRERYRLATDPAELRTRLAELALDVERSRDPRDALALFECGLEQTDALTRVASAIAYRRFAQAEAASFVPTLVACVADEDPLVAGLARDELARIAPRHPALAPFLNPPQRAPGRPSHTSLLVHGTWARDAQWWPPGGDFHSYLRDAHVPDLYAGADAFAWSGAWSPTARALAAVELDGWLAAHQIPRLAKGIAHSHGANVLLHATHGTLAADQLVLLSCPVHADEVLPNPAHVSDVVSFQVHLDLVVLADGGGLVFREPGIRDVTIPVWFDHGASHDADVWDEYGLASHL